MTTTGKVPHKKDLHNLAQGLTGANSFSELLNEMKKQPGMKYFKLFLFLEI
jgi:hypothetical protein